MNTRKHPLTMEFALLGILRRQPMHGYDIHQRLLAGTEEGLVWRIKQGLLYSMLARLESEGLLSSEVETQGVRPPRKLFSLTERGETLLQAWLQTPVRNGRDFRLEFLTKLYFAQQTGAEAALTLVQRQVAASEAQLNQFVQEAAAAAQTDSFIHLVNDFRIGQLEASLAWLRRCEAAFAGKQAQE